MRTVTHGFTMGYFHILPDGRMEEPESRWLGFVVSHPWRKVRVKDGAPGTRLHALSAAVPC